MKPLTVSIFQDVDASTPEEIPPVRRLAYRLAGLANAQANPEIEFLPLVRVLEVLAEPEEEEEEADPVALRFVNRWLEEIGLALESSPRAIDERSLRSLHDRLRHLREDSINHRLQEHAIRVWDREVRRDSSSPLAAPRPLCHNLSSSIIA
jgi:hypothetical protein